MWAGQKRSNELMIAMKFAVQAGKVGAKKCDKGLKAIGMSCLIDLI